MKRKVLITGASSGIGKAMAQEFAKRGDSLFLTGRNEEALGELQKKLQKKYHIQIYTMVVDLEEKNGVQRLYEESRKKMGDVDILVNNAGFGYVGEFLSCKKKVMEGMLRVNMEAVTELSFLFGEDMKKRGQGAILNVASTGSYHPGPYTAVYYATKAYVLSLSEALAKEWKNYGITVSAVCPGATKTKFSMRAGRKENPLAMSAEYVAKKAVKGLEKRKTVIIPGIFYRFFVKIPRKIATYFIAAQQKNMSHNIDN